MRTASRSRRSCCGASGRSGAEPIDPARSGRSDGGFGTAELRSELPAAGKRRGRFMPRCLMPTRRPAAPARIRQHGGVQLMTHAVSKRRRLTGGKAQRQKSAEQAHGKAVLSVIFFRLQFYPRQALSGDPGTPSCARAASATVPLRSPPGRLDVPVVVNLVDQSSRKGQAREVVAAHANGSHFRRSRRPHSAVQAIMSATICSLTNCPFSATVSPHPTNMLRRRCFHL